jgi:2-methylcitrate dehydratase PrpD
VIASFCFAIYKCATWVAPPEKPGYHFDMSVVTKLAAFVAHTDVAALPVAERALQARHVLDALVAAAAAARTAEARSLAALLGGRGRPERIGERAATIRLSEIDDIHLPGCTTPSAAAVATALSLAAEAGDFDPMRVASAIWAGTETMTRMGEAVRGPEILYRGVWPSCLAAPLSVAATAARMQGFDPDRTAAALSLALMLTTRGTGRPHGSPSFRWAMFAAAVAAGLSAVEAVAGGYRGDPALLDGSAFEESWGFPLDRDCLAGASLERSVYPELSLKPFCSAKQAIAAVEAFWKILQTGLALPSITAVRVRVPPAYAGMISLKAQPGVRTSTLVSVARQLALVAHARARLYDVDRSAPVTDPAIVQLEAKVEVVADAALAQYYPRAWPAEVEVEAQGGTVRERVIEAQGDPGHPLGEAEHDAKAHRVLDPLTGRDAAERLIEVGRRGLADAAGCRALVAAFVSCFTAA